MPWTRGDEPRLEDGMQVVIGAEVGNAAVQAAVAVQRQLALVEGRQLLPTRLLVRTDPIRCDAGLVVCRRSCVVAQCMLAGACQGGHAHIGCRAQVAGKRPQTQAPNPDIEGAGPSSMASNKA